MDADTSIGPFLSHRNGTLRDVTEVQMTCHPGRTQCAAGKPAHALRTKDAELLTPGRHRGASAEHTTPGLRWQGGK